MKPASLRIVAVPFLLYLLHACLFGGWIVDDAGISFAYARNLAAGHGLVAQPGIPPVEGYSNFLWVVLTAVFLSLGLFDPMLTPKLVGVALTGVLFLGFQAALRRLDPAGGAVAFVALTLTALNTSFAVWTVSGLENPLYAALIGLLFWLLVRERTGGPRPWLSAVAGAVAVGIALTRPDGVLYAALYPLLTWGAEGRPWRTGAAAGRIARFAAVFLVLFGAFLAFRLAYFGDLQPNTYHAKSAPMTAVVRDLLLLKPSLLGRLREPLESAAGELGGPLVALLAMAGTVFLAVRRRLLWAHAVLLGFTGCAGLIYILLPGDWMREYRFATPFYPFFYAGAGLLAVSVARELMPLPGSRKVAGGLLAVAALGLAPVLFLPRSRAYAANPALSFFLVEERNGRGFNRFADALDLHEGSFLVPDIGGALWSSRLRIYDLAGLTDRTVARTLKKDPEAFYDYVFGVARPTFILAHGPWAYTAALNRDPRFARDYVPLYLEGDPGGRTVTAGPGLQAGVFVRKEAVAGKEAVVEAIRAELAVNY